jgi:hypothetical protein
MRKPLIKEEEKKCWSIPTNANEKLVGETSENSIFPDLD